MKKTGILLAAIAMAFSTAMAQGNFTESGITLPNGAKSLDMIHVDGGTFQMGCSNRSNPSCGANESPVHSVTLSNYYIGKYEVTRAQWRAVMGNANTPSLMFTYGVSDTNNIPINTIDWYYANEFVCELNKKTGKKYRLATEAEWEFAARGGKNSNGYAYSGSANVDDVAWHQGNVGSNSYMAKPVGGKASNELGTYDMSGNVREWTYDSFSQSYNEGAVTNPTGPDKLHSQKIRRGGGFMTPSSQSTVTGRLIRSIEGADGDLGFRLALSENQNTIPAGMVAPCDIQKPPVIHGKGTLRDDRLITGNDEAWSRHVEYNGTSIDYVLIVRANGSAVMAQRFGTYTTVQASGDWATANDFSLYIVNSSGTRSKYIYYIVSESDMTLMEDNGMPDRWMRRPISEVSWVSSQIPAPTNRLPENLVPPNAAVNMDDPPTSGKDQRLIITQFTSPNSWSGNAWLQDNVAGGFGGTHRYRFDYTADTARFTVWDVAMGTSVIISTGKWFTIDDTFLRIIGDNGRRYDYLYTVTTNGNTHYHISFQGYERGDFRMFDKETVQNIKDNAQWTKEPDMEPYKTNANGGSTYLSPDSARVAEGITSVQIPVGTQRLTASLVTVHGRTLNVNANSSVRIRVVNLAGKTVANFNAASGATLSLNEIPSGVYIIEAKSLNGHKTTSPVMLR
jgi:formylglycine-generating enzyme required for sulfatase activity